jgi:L-rhamnose 1-dehydrogenase
MQSAAIALGRHAIRCNSLLPGTILTEINKEDLADEAKRRYMEGRVPLGRLGVPEDMVGPAVFLASRHGALCDRRGPAGRWRRIREPAIGSGGGWRFPLDMRT